MLVGEHIFLRLFEPDDYILTHRWHSDPEIQTTICCPRRIISKEIEKNWVASKSTNNIKDIYLAICLKETDEMIGWYSINNIDYQNRCCHLGGVVIGEKRYRDGLVHREAGSLVTAYVFNQLNMHKATGSCLQDHIMSRSSMEVSGWHYDGIERDAFFKDGKYHTICHYSILENEYRTFIPFANEVDYAKKIVEISRRIKSELKSITIQ